MCTDCNQAARYPGRGSYCLECARARARARYHEVKHLIPDRPCAACGEAPRATRAYCGSCHRAKCAERYRSDPQSREKSRQSYRKHAEKRAAEARARRAEDPDVYVARHVKSRYGLEVADLESLYASQSGRCAICAREAPIRGRDGLHVDHCHVTGKVRGLLCTGCNQGLGRFRDSAERLEAAAEYLRKARG
jgi:hypothetical protein